MTEAKYRTLASARAFDGHVLHVRVDDVQMPDGVAKREVVEHPGAVAIVALSNDDGADVVTLVRQYRHPVQRFLLELPAGLLDVQGEPALDAAKRELFEEARLRADRWDVLVDLYTSPGMTTEAVRVYLARDLAAADGAFTPTGEEVELEMQRRSLDDAVAAVLAGDITNSIAVAGLLAAARARETGFGDLRPADAPWSAKPDLAG